MTMRSLRHVSIIIALFAVASICHARYTQVYAPKPGDAMPAYIYRLDNGLTIYLTRNNQAPRFYSEIAVRAGSKNDPAETTGLAHYLEHLMFKGSQHLGTLDYAAEKPHMDRIRQLYEEHFRENDPAKRKQLYERINKETQLSAQFAIPNEIDRLYGSFGASDLNAHTGDEETVYQVGLPINRLGQWAAVEADRFLAPVFRLFVTELETVYEEKNRSMDNKENLLMEGVLAQLFKHHPYGQQTTLGRPEHLKRPSIKNIEDFYRRNYVPGNMGVFISGDIDPDKAMPILDEYFSSWKAQPVPAKQEWKEEPIKGVERVKIPYRGEEKVLLAFRTAPEKSADKEALMVFDMLLDNSVAGLINLNLNQAQKVREAGSYPMIMNDYGAQFLWGVPKQGQTLQQVEQLLLDQVQLIRKGEFEDWIIPAIINDFEKNQKQAMEENSGRVQLMRSAFIAEEDWPFAIHELDRIRKVTKADVMRVANEYFSGGYVSGYRVDEDRQVPFIEKPSIEKVQIDPSRESPFAKQITEMPVQEIQPIWVNPEKDFEIYQDAQGTRYYYNKNPINDLFSLSIRIEKGSRHDRTLPVAIQLLEKSGAKEFNTIDLKKEWYKLGTDFNVSAGENETVISISGLEKNLIPSLFLLNDVLNAPVSDQATLDELVNIILVQREDAKKDQNTILSAVTQYNRYGKDSRFLQMLPTQQLRGLKTDDLLTTVTSLMSLQRKVFYTGSLSSGDFLYLFDGILNHEHQLQPAPAYVHLQVRAPEANEIEFFDKPLAQSLIRLEFGHEKYQSAHVPKAQLYNEYFDGGMGGIVFQELREARALAYVVGAQYVLPERPVDQNIMVGVINCQPDKSDEAVGEFIRLMDEMPLSPERFSHAEEAVESQYRDSRITFRGILGAVLSWERLGLPIDPRPQWFAQVLQLKLNDLKDFSEKEIAKRPKLISIVGDSAKMDMTQLEKFGTVRKVSTGEIFVK